MASSPLVSTQSVHYQVGDRTLFEGLTFGIFESEKIALVGRNGAGKSTLLKMIYGEIDPDEGGVVRKRGLRVAYLAQTPVLPNDLTVRDFVCETNTLDGQKMLSEFDLGDRQDQRCGKLSGGWQKRVALAREMAQNPDLVLLDEPTNHLDIESILWLESWIKKCPQAFLIISHDRAFLRNLSQRVIELDRRYSGGVLSVDAGYDEFLERKAAYLEAEAARETSLNNVLRRETEWLRRGAKARTTKQKARIDRAQDLAQESARLKTLNRNLEIKLEFSEQESQAPKKLIELKSATLVRGGRTLFKDFSLLITRSTRLGLLGANGIGKSSLAQVLLKQLSVESGSVTESDRLQAVYFDQKRDQLDPDTTVLRTVCPYGETVEFQGKKLHVRSYLDRFFFFFSQVDQRVGALSGGEQARLLLALLMMQPANLLILDEPTNDLDLQTLQVLEECLSEFDGAVILVSHDRQFMDDVCDQILAFPEMKFYTDTGQWRQAQRGSATNTGMKLKSSLDSGGTDSPKAAKKKLTYSETIELSQIEQKIQDAEKQVRDLEVEMSSAELVSQSVRLRELSFVLGEAQQKLESLFERWQELEDKKQ